MRPEPKRDYRQQRLAFEKKELWEKLSPSSRVRCSDLIVELLRVLILVRAPRREHERKD